MPSQSFMGLQSSKHKSQQISVNKVNPKLISTRLPKPKSQLLLRHTFLDSSNETNAFSANIWYTQETQEIRIQTYDVDTKQNSEVVIDLHTYFTGKFVNIVFWCFWVHKCYASKLLILHISNQKLFYTIVFELERKIFLALEIINHFIFTIIAS